MYSMLNSDVKALSILHTALGPAEIKMMISIIIPTYNRAHCLSRALDSVVLQDYTDWEILVVDDGSTDTTVALLESYTDTRVRLIRHPVNRGVGAAKNTGLDHIRGDWFTILDSDDEMTKGALTAFTSIARRDPAITAITCNCIDSVSGSFTGQGFDHDQYLMPGQIFKDGRGEFWGITKTELLQGKRLNEKVVSWESILWFAIEKNARRYYTHKALRVYHTEGGDRISKMSGDAPSDKERDYQNHLALLGEKDFLANLKQWRPDQYRGIIFSAGSLLIERNKRARALQCGLRLLACPGGLLKGGLLCLGFIFGNSLLTCLKQAKHFLKRTGRAQKMKW